MEGKKDAFRSGADHALRVYSDITGLIASPDNPTPLVRVNRTGPARAFEVYLKLERYNPFGSVKDRIAIEMVKALNVDGRTLVEPSSGNTGIALTCVATARGISVEIVVPKGVPEEKKVMLRFLGARVTEADDQLCPLFPTEGARGLVNALVNSPATQAQYVSPNQYENHLNVEAHYRGTGPEIWRQTQGRVTHFFAGYGTCGTITGVARYLKEQDPRVRVIGVEPASSGHKLPGLKRITGLDDGLVPKILDRSLIDDSVQVSDEDAYGTAIELARKDGIPVGPTTGAILHAALRYPIPAGGLAVVISPDDAFKYTSFYKAWLDKEPGAVRARDFDLSGLVCPLSRVRAMELLDGMAAGETAQFVLGNAESLASVAQELKARRMRPEFRQEGEDRFILAVTK